MDREAHHRELIGRFFDLFVVVDELGTFLDVGESARPLYGYEPAELVGTSAFDLIHPADIAAAAEELAAELDPGNRSRALTIRLRTTSGSWRAVEMLGANHVDTDGVGGVLVALRDVTGERLGDRVLAANEYLFRTLTMTSSDFTVITDADDTVRYVSPSVERVLGVPPDDSPAYLAAIPVHPDDQASWSRAQSAALSGGFTSMSRNQLRMRRADDRWLWCEVLIVNLLDDPRIGGMVSHVRDIDEEHLAAQALHRLSRLDALTGLVNRRAFLDELAAMVDGTEPAAVVFVDLDGFKSVNDRVGHVVGDLVLAEAAGRIRAAVRPEDIVARLGGDEFCVACAGMADLTSALVVAERIVAAFTEPVEADGAPFQLGASVGVACHPGGPVRPEELVARADRAMYAAKGRGGRRAEPAD